MSYTLTLHKKSYLLKGLTRDDPNKEKVKSAGAKWNASLGGWLFFPKQHADGLKIAEKIGAEINVESTSPKKESSEKKRKVKDMRRQISLSSLKRSSDSDDEELSKLDILQAKYNKLKAKYKKLKDKNKKVEDESKEDDDNNDDSEHKKCVKEFVELESVMEQPSIVEGKLCVECKEPVGNYKSDGGCCATCDPFEYED